jgi:hypothetical protein
MAQDFRSPIDESGPGQPGIGLMAGALVVAVLLLLLGNGGALVAWAEARPPGARAALLVAAAHGIADPGAQAGLQAPVTGLRAWWNAIKAARWPEQAAAAGDQR